MTPILIDITRLVYRRLSHTLPTGIDRVSIEYLRHYGGRARAVLGFGPFSAVMSAGDSARLFRAVADPAEPAGLLLLTSIAKAILWRWLALDVAGSFLFNTGHVGLENRFHAWALRWRGARPIVVVHDLIPITHPEYCRPGERARHVARMTCAARISAGVVANSHHTLEVLTGFCREHRLPMPPAIVARLAHGLPSLPPGPRPLAAPYFVILGTIEPRKNHWMLLQLWRRLVDLHGERAPRLVVIGQRGWECENVVDLLERCQQLQGIVIEHPRCTDAELVTWLHHAQALLFASFAEGYGLPVAEALSLGVPVIASELPVFREIAGDVPEYADPLDGQRWEALVTDYAQPDSPLRAAQLARMHRFHQSTWPEHFERVDALLTRLDNAPLVAGTAAGADAVSRPGD